MYSTQPRAARTNIVAIFGELFHGGKLPPSQELLVEVLFGMLGYVGGSDSIITSHEAEFANHLMQDFDLPIRGCELALTAFQAGRKRQLDIDTELKRFVAEFPQGSVEASKLYEAVLQLAKADQRIRPSERVVLEQITKRLGFSIAVLDKRLKAAD